ncbi:MAG: uracil-DNA glycosylase [Planctomycetota bacterium]
MTDQTREILSSAARQLLAIETLLGCEYIPGDLPKLPDFQAAPPAAPAAAAQDPARSRPPAAGPAAAGHVPPEQKPAALARMDEDEVRHCTRCALCKGRTRTVFGEGNPNADLVFVGEGPGHDEDISGRPFVGRAGQLLDKMIAAMGLTRDDVFICNVVKCRPPNNRNPMPEEVDACWDYLIRQLQIIAPKAIVTLGNPATKKLLDTTTGITRLRGSWQQLPDYASGLEGIPVMPTFHPAYVLRQYTADNRGKVWSDLQQVMAQIGLDLPEKT